MKTFNFLTLILISFKSAVFISFNFWAVFLHIIPNGVQDSHD